MAIKWISLPRELKQGAEILTGKYDKDLTIEAICGEELHVKKMGKHAVITYHKKVEFFRGLGYVLCEEGDLSIKEKPHFDMLGAMLDMSRNAVMKVEKVMEYIEFLARMGFHSLMLYNEDVYEIEDRNFFGYMRGKYTKREIKEIDDYADLFGIEVIACIQTLGHMEQYLKWTEANDIKDTASVLFSGEDATYAFIENMIKSATEPLRSKRIHIGMDEAHDIGLGRYLSKNGYVRRFDILVNHLKKVHEITEKLGLKPMMWGDMFFRLGSKRHAYYDLEIEFPEDVKNNVPSDMGIVYWDYYNNDADFYRKFLDIHYELSENIIFAGCVWSHRGIMPDYHTTIATTAPALKACVEKNIKEVFATLWGDDGAENSYFTCLAGLQMFAEYCYQETEPDLKLISKRAEDCLGIGLEPFMDMSVFHNALDKSHEEIIGEISKMNMNDILRGRHEVGRRYLWQDILCGVFDYQIMQHPVSDIYQKAYETMLQYQADGYWNDYIQLARLTFDLLAEKTYVAQNLYHAYQHGQKDVLQSLLSCFDEMKQKAEKLRTQHRTVWFAENKPFGFEALDIRYGGLIVRIDSSGLRIKDYLDEKIDKLEELEEERLACARVQDDWRYRSFVTCGIL